MNNRDRTTAIVDRTLTIMVTGSAISASLVLPGLIIGLEKPLNVFWKHMDKRSRERELRTVITYMKSRDLIRGNYDHGLQITNKGRKRLQKIEFKKLTVKSPQKWDRRWRLIFFDIPENLRQNRKAFIRKLSSIGCRQLQKSVWIHPFPCREVIEKIANFDNVDTHVTYVETSYIDNEKKLKEMFKNILKN